MKKIIPIKDLRNTNEISKMCKETNEPIHVTKNGYSDLVIMSHSCYKRGLKEMVPVDPITFNDDEFEEQDEALGYIKVSSCNIKGKIGHVKDNAKNIISKIKELSNLNSKIIVFPELVLTSYSCEDMFLSNTLISNVYKGLENILDATKEIDSFIVISSPLLKDNSLYNCAIAIFKGEILGVVPKEITSSKESRYFTTYERNLDYINIFNKKVPFGNKLLFINKRYLNQKISIGFSKENLDYNANIFCKLNAEEEVENSSEIRKMLETSTSIENKVAVILSSSSYDESSSEVVYSGYNLIVEPDGVLKESSLFDSSSITSDIDLDRIEILKRNTKKKVKSNTIYFSSEINFSSLDKKYEPFPFINRENPLNQARKILLTQAKALERRLRQISCTNVVLGISGGLDSTISLLVCVKAFDLMNLDRKQIHAITLPCFGTTSRTKDNATTLCEKLGVNLSTINIKEAVTVHLNDINVSLSDRSVTFENAQARERTQVLLDYSNKVNGIVIGTGDLSEIALGWATYNGDHMSNYNVNCSLPKTLIRSMAQYLSDDFVEVKDILLDILDTPVSPELLPPEEGKISQITEDKIGPYELHDFFLYHFIYHNLDVVKVYKMACSTFEIKYTKEVIKNWFVHFIKRFFNNQFKRSCSPDGPKVTKVSLSPRSSFFLPSDASGYDFLNKLNEVD